VPRLHYQKPSYETPMEIDFVLCSGRRSPTLSLHRKQLFAAIFTLWMSWRETFEFGEPLHIQRTTLQLHFEELQVDRFSKQDRTQPGWPWTVWQMPSVQSIGAHTSSRTQINDTKLWAFSWTLRWTSSYFYIIIMHHWLLQVFNSYGMRSVTTDDLFKRTGHNTQPFYCIYAERLCKVECLKCI